MTWPTLRGGLIRQPRLPIHVNEPTGRQAIAHVNARSICRPVRSVVPCLILSTVKTYSCVVGPLSCVKSYSKTRSFFKHHTQQLARSRLGCAAQVGDAKGIRRKITQMKIRLMKDVLKAGGRA